MILAVATQAQWLNYGYGLGAGYGHFGGYYPIAGTTTAYAGALPTAYAGYPASFPYYGYPAVTSSQYHSQDELGQARFGYSHPGQAATNYRDAFGNQIGSYAYFNPEGKEVRVSYTADSRGFRVLSNDLPVAPIANLVAPLPVQDTPEVAQAKAEHLALKTKVATPASRAKRQVVSPLGYNFIGSPYNYSPLAYNHATPVGYSYGQPYGFNYPYVGYPLGYNFATPVVASSPGSPASTVKTA